MAQKKVSEILKLVEFLNEEVKEVSMRLPCMAGGEPDSRRNNYDHYPGKRYLIWLRYCLAAKRYHNGF